jgi:hypothetical protein
MPDIAAGQTVNASEPSANAAEPDATGGHERRISGKLGNTIEGKVMDIDNNKINLTESKESADKAGEKIEPQTGPPQPPTDAVLQPPSGLPIILATSPGSPAQPTGVPPLQAPSGLPTQVSVLTVVGLAMGAASLLGLFLPYLSAIALILALSGLIISIVALVKAASEKQRGKLMAIAGIVFSFATLVIICCMFVFGIIVEGLQSNYGHGPTHGPTHRLPDEISVTVSENLAEPDAVPGAAGSAAGTTGATSTNAPGATGATPVSTFGE